MKKADAVVIGFGKGGKTLAGALAEAGRSVIMVERSDKMYGGTCINVACIPTKSLVHSAALSAAMGGSFAEKAERYAAAIFEKDRLTGALRGKNYHKLADHPNVTVLTGDGSFLDARHVAVAMADGSREEIEAGQVFINTGARPFVPPIPGLKESRYVYLSESLLDRRDLPRRLVIIGGGYIGMEFASMYANFGSQVTVLQDGAVFLPREDQEVAGAVLESLAARGVEVLRSTKTLGVEDVGDHAEITIENADGRRVLEAEALLVATGRRPNVAGLNLGAAGVELTDRGAVKTDEHLRTTAPNIWAMGDVAGGLQFTYISLDDFRIVKSAVLGDGSRTTANRGQVPYSVFLDPPFSRVGLTEQEARDKGYSVKIARLAAAAIPKANVLQKPTGLLKAVIDADTGLILGAHLFCEESYETINLIKLAMDAKVPYTVLRDSIYTHPTMTEALNDLFGAVHG
ncbi:FAD-dependent oxidoreductase [Pseudoflavonifractor phocaeensis]|uniref:FAD-dependent oxidoreductase n=1 Tax=Pseudoflavonifractor phocaeensis TaxID=1870988 RepID=UPI00313D01D9